MDNLKDRKTEYRRSLLTDFYIEFLGSLVPGLFALMLALVVLSLSILVFCRAFMPNDLLPPFPQTFDFGLGSYGATGMLLVAAYVLGSIFYRQDPKLPDWISAKRAYKRQTTDREKKRLAVQPTSRVPEGHGKIHKNDAQFPYFFLYEYLTGRHLAHLAKWVPWKGSDPDTWKFRSKMFINQLKIRLQFLVPDKCKDIIRNEAHVRLATSVWYATRWLLGVCAICSLILAAAVWRALPIKIDEALSATIVAILLTTLLAAFIMRHVENFIHYLRVREIVYVLETAHFASLNNYNLHPEDFNQEDNRETANEDTTTECSQSTTLFGSNE